MAVTVKCWGFEIKKMAKIFSILGLLLSGLSFLTIIYIPLSFALLAAFILVLDGLKNLRSSYMLIAQIIFFSVILLNAVLVLAFLTIGLRLDVGDSCDTYFSSCIQILFIRITSYKLRVILFVFDFTLLALNGFIILSIIIVHKTRNVIIFEYLEAHLPPEEPQQHRNFGGRAFQNVYSADQNSSAQNDYLNPSQMSTADYININASAPYYQR